MKKESFFKGTFILIIVGVVVKLFGLINRIIIARILQPAGVGIYMMSIPTLVLGITLVQLGFPVVVSKLIAENEKSNKNSNRKIVFTALILGLIMSAIVCLSFYLATPYLAKYFLNEERAFYPLIAVIITLPFISISGTLKGYLQGMRYMSVTAYSQLAEQVFRIISAYALVFLLEPFGLEMQVFGAVLSTAVGEIGAILYIFIKLKRNHIKIKAQKLTQVKKYSSDFFDSTKTIMQISLPTTGNRLIGSIVYFFEPIVFSLAILKLGLSSAQSTETYGNIAGMVIPMLLMPSFISVILSYSSVPLITETFYRKNYTQLIKHIKNIFLISFVPGILTTLVFLEYPKEMMHLFYGTTAGSKYLQIMAPFFILHYIQHPLTTILQVMGKAKDAMYTTLIGGILKLLIIFTLVPIPRIGVWGFIIAVLVNITFVTALHYKELRKIVKLKIEKQIIVNTFFILLSIIITIYFINTLLPNLTFLIKLLLLIALYFITIYTTNFGKIKTNVISYIKNKKDSSIKN